MCLKELTPLTAGISPFAAQADVWSLGVVLYELTCLKVAGPLGCGRLALGFGSGDMVLDGFWMFFGC